MASKMITTVRTFSIAERLERLPLRSYQKTIFLIIATAWLFDCVDIAMMTFALTSIKTSFDLNTAQTGLLASMSLIGMLPGAATAGMLADRFGRRTVFQWSMVIWGISSFLCASATSVGALMVYRVLLGIGMAMEFPVGQSLICEMTPAKKRGQYIAVLAGFMPVGFIVAGILSYLILPVGGWRWLFIAQGISAVFVFVIRRYVPESPRWLEETGKQAEANSVMNMIESKVQIAQGDKPLPEPQALSCPKYVIQPRFALKEIWGHGYAKRSIMLWCIWFFALFGYYGLTTWLGALLQAAGYTLTKSTLYIVLINLAGVPGFLTMAWLLEIWGRRQTVILAMLGSAATAYLYGTAGNIAQVIVFGLAMQFFVCGMWSVIYAYTPELYPTNIRASGSGFASSFGRIGALLGPYIVGLVLPAFGQIGVFQLGAGTYVAAALAVLLLGEETKGKVLEELCPVNN